MRPCALLESYKADAIAANILSQPTVYGSG